MNSKVFLTVFLLYLNISICYSHAVLNINTKSEDNLNQNEAQNSVNIFSIHNEVDKELVKKFRDDYTLYPGHGFYKYHIEGALWHNAKYICELEGAHLAVINSQAEADLMSLIITSFPKPNLPEPHWTLLGFHDKIKDGEFVTILGGMLKDTGYTKWGSGQPNNAFGKQDCGCVHSGGLLDDCTCTTPYSFMCEKEFVK